MHTPVDALVELARVVRPGGAVLATVMSAGNHSAVRDRIDAVAGAHGFAPPDWYAELTGEQAPLLGSAERMERAARDAGLHEVRVEEGPADLGLTSPAALVDYRLGQAQFAHWFAGLDAATRATVRREALAAVAPAMEPYQPGVVQLTAEVRSRSSIPETPLRGGDDGRRTREARRRRTTMTRYLLAIQQPDDPTAPEAQRPEPDRLAAIMRDVEAVRQDMVDAGVWVFSGGLHSREHRDGGPRPRDEVLLTDGPYAEGKEQIGGLRRSSTPRTSTPRWGGRAGSRGDPPLPIEVRPFQDELTCRWTVAEIACLPRASTDAASPP